MSLSRRSFVELFLQFWDWYKVDGLLFGVDGEAGAGPVAARVADPDLPVLESSVVKDLSDICCGGTKWLAVLLVEMID